MRLIQLNIERNNHIDKFIPLIEELDPDIVCLQEITRPTFDAILDSNGYQGAYAPMTRLHGFEPGTEDQEMGVALFTKHAFNDINADYYVGDGNEIRDLQRGNPQTYVDGLTRVLLSAEVKMRNESHIVGTTHFTWSKDGENTIAQKEHLDSLFDIFKMRDPDIVTGDFNIPRGTGFYRRIAEYYKDNVPSDIRTTIDQRLHRVRRLELVVDYVWTRPDVSADVEVHCGVSDHCALVAEV